MPFDKKLVALWTIVRKEVVRFVRIWPQTLLPSAITQTLYFLIFGTFIGSQIRDISGVSYMAFIIPGLVMMAVITNAFNNVVSSFFGSKFQKNLEELMVSPTPNWVIITGFTIGGVLRWVAVGIIVFLVSLFFVRPTVYSYSIILLFVTLTATLFSLGGLLNGMLAKKFDDVGAFLMFVLTPLTYLGGVFYSIKDLPPFWQMLSHFNPIVYMVDGFRYWFFGKSDIGIMTNLGILIVFIVVLSLLVSYLLRKWVGMRN